MNKKKINILNIYNKYFLNNKVVKLINFNSEYIGLFKIEDVSKNFSNLKLNLFQVNKYDIIITYKFIKYNIFINKIKSNNYKNKKKIKKIKTKEMKFNYSIKNFDYINKINKILYFFKKKHRVKIIIIPKGREFLNKNLEKRLIKSINSDLYNYGRLQLPYKYINKNLLMFYYPKKN